MFAMLAPLVIAGMLSGTITTADGRPVPAAAVSVHGTADRVVVADAQGRVDLPDTPLPVTLDVVAPGFRPVSVTVSASPFLVTLEPFAVTDSVVVVGRSAPALRDPSTGVTVLGREDLDLVPAATPDEALKAVSGFSLFRRSSSRASNPTTHGVTMRGLSASGASRALIVVDGVPLIEGFGGWTTWERLPAAAIDQVRVQRGPSGDAFGSDALGGVIRLITPAGAAPRANLVVESGSLETWTLSADAGGALGRAALFGAASWFGTAGFIPLEPASRGVIDTPMDTTWTNGYGRASLGPATRRWTASGWGGRDVRNNGTSLQRNRSHGGTGTLAFDGLRGAWTFAARGAYGTNAYEQTFSSVVASRATERLTATHQIDGTFGRAAVEVGRSLPQGQVTVRGTAARTSSAFTTISATTGVATTRSLDDDSQAVSVQAAWAPRPDVTLTAGGRHEWRQAPLSDSPSKTATVGRVSAAWRVTPVFTLRAAAATSHRWPTLNELARDFSAGSTTTQANADLSPERARAFEGGVDMTVADGRGQVTVTGFRTVVRDAIANVTLSSTSTAIVRQRRNAGEAVSNGVEVDGQAQLGRLRLRASMTVADAAFRHSLEAALEGNRLPQVPRVSNAFTADLRLPGQVVASLVVRDAARQFDDDRNQFTLARATQADALVSGRWRRATVTVTFENLTDARVETGRTPLVALAQGRSVRLAIRWSLK